MKTPYQFSRRAMLMALFMFVSVTSLVAARGQLTASIRSLTNPGNATAPVTRTLAPEAISTIVNFDFNSGNSYGSLAPALASGVLCQASSTENFNTVTGTATGGTAFTTNATAGTAINMTNSSGTNTRYFQFVLTGASLPIYDSYKVYVQAQRSATGAQTVTLAYSTDGTNFTNFGTTLSPGDGTFVAQVFDLSSIAGLNNKSIIYFRLLASGASGSGTLRIDNFQVQANSTAPSAPSLAGNKSATLLTDLNSNGFVNPGDTLMYSVTYTNNGTDASNVVFTDMLNGNLTLVGGSVNASPIAVNDSYQVLGNVSINVNNSGSGLLGNDFDPAGGSPLTVTGIAGCSDNTAPFNCTSARGGDLVVQSNGQFSYNPPPGFEGADFFVYTISDGTKIDVGTATLNVSGMIWFIDNNSGPVGDGRLGTPFNSVSNFNSIAADDPGDNIFLYRLTATNYTGPLTLLANQKLIGQGATASLSSITGLTPPAFSPALPSTGGTRPVIAVNNNGANAHNLTISSGNTLRGFDLQNSSTGSNQTGAGLFGTSFNNLNASEMSVSVSSNQSGNCVAAISLDQGSGTASINASFTSVSSNNCSNGILLADTTGSFTVNGDGSNTSVGGNSSGGTISNAPGADGAVAGNGVYLSNTANVTLRRMTISGVNQNHGIRGLAVNNFTLEYSTVGAPNPTNAASVASNTQGTSSSGQGEGAIYFGTGADGNIGLSGTGTFTNNNISAGRYDNMRVVNGGGTLNRLTITGSTFGLNSAALPQANAALTVIATRAASGNTILNSTVTGNTFTGSPGNAANFTGQEPTTALGISMDTIFQNNTISNNHANNNIGGSNLTVAGFSNTTFNVSNNTMRDANGSAITLQMGAPVNGSTVATSFSGTVNNNTIGVTGVAGSGSASGNGIFCSFADNTTAPKGQVTLAITNNQIRRYNGNGGIYADNTGGNYDINFTITGNLTAEPGPGAFAGLALTAGAPASSNDIDVCANITGNNFSAGDPANANDIIIGGGASGASSIRLPGLSPASNPTQAQVQSFVLSNNNVAGTVVTAYVDAPATFNSTFLGGAACSTPSTFAPTIEVSDLQLKNQEISQKNSFTPNATGSKASPGFLARLRQWLNPVIAAFSAPVGYVDLDRAFNKAAESIVPSAAAATMAGETVTVPSSGSFTLPAGKSITVMFNAQIGAGFTGTSVANQASVSGSNFATINSNNLVTEVFQPPMISKAFSPTTIPSNGNSTITLTLTNPNALPQTNASFTDTLTNMSAVGGAVGGTCIGTTPNTLAGGATNLGFSGITIPASGSCTVTFAVTSSTTGIHPNQTSGVTTAQTTPTAGAPSNTANLTVLDPPTIAKAFSPALIPFGGTSIVTLTLGNTNSINLTNASFTDTLTNMSAVGGAVGGTCTGTTPASLAANATALSFSGITIPSAGACTVTFAVKSNVIGMHNNQTSGVTTAQTLMPGLASNVAVLTVVKADTTTTITADNPDPSVVGQSVAVNYNVSVNAPGSGTPAGNVTITASTGEMCTGTVAAGTCNITFNTVGLRTLTAAYAGDTNFNGSSSATENHTVNKANTTTAITSDNPDPSVVGQSVTVNYSVTVGAPGSGTPTGNVTVTASTGETCTATVAAGTCNITFNTAGSRTLTAAYAGDSNFNSSTSATENHTVNKADTTTAITADTPDPSVVGQPYAVTANVTVNAPGTGTPTGTITVSDGTGGTCVINLPGTSCNLTSITAGAKTLTATYNGDAEFNSSASAGVPHQVNKADTTTNITADTPDPSVVGQPYAVTANVAVNAPGAGTPTGTITVSDGSQTCNITLPATSCNLTSTTAGAKTLTATYNGDANFNASPASAGVPHQVDKANTTTAITSDNPDPSAVGQSVTVNFTVTASAPGSGTPTGNVTVSDGVNSCVGTVAAGTCNITLTTAGARILTATYAGDANYNGSTSAGEPHTVNQAATTTAITNDSPDPTVVGQPYTVTFSVTVNAPGTGTPTGTVTVSDGSQTCMATLPATTCNLTSTTAGAKNLTATYSGDSNFSGSVSATAPHTVNKANTTIGSLTDSPDPSVTGQAYTVGFTLSVVSPGAGTPTGTVTVNDGTGGTCTATLPATTCSLTSTTVGAKTLTFTYNGDANFNTSSNTAGHQVNKANTTTAITSDNPDPSAVGQSVTVNFTVTAAAPGSGTPTGNVTVSDGVDSCTGTVAAGTCNITLTTPGNRTLTASYAGDANFNSSTSAGEPHLVANPPALTKIFTPSSIPVGGTSTLQFTINNTNGFAINGIAFSDTLPAGVTVTTTGPTATCGGTLTTTAPDQIAFTGGSVNANSNCQFSVTVTGATFGVKNNTTSTITSSNAGTGTAATAQLKVIAPPGLTKAFGAPSIPLGTTTSLTFTISNPNTAGTTNTALSGISFTDTLPAGLSVASTGPTATCGGTVTTTSPNSIAFSGGSLAAGASCNFSVTVTGAQAGNWTNTVNSISSTEGGTNSTPATAGIIVVAPPAIAKSFSPTTVQINGISTLTISITNPAANTVALTGVAVTDNFPAGLQVDTTPMATNSCGTGTFAPAASATSVTISGATIPVNTTCTFTVKVKGTTSGPKVNTTLAVTSANGGTGNSATATLTVGVPPTIAKAFGATDIALNGTTSLTFNINNSNPLPLTGVAFTDSLPAGLVIATPSALSTSCGGVVTANAGASSISLTGGTIAASGSCVISLNVRGTTPGPKNNTTSVITANETGPGLTSNTATVTVHPISISIADPAICLGTGGLVGVTATVTNAANSSQPVNFTATLPAQLLALPGTCTVNTGTCNVVNAGTVNWSGTLASGQTVTIKYQAQVAETTPTGTQLCINSAAVFNGGTPVTVQACTTVNCPSVGPGILPAGNSPVSDQRGGSILIYNIYTSSATASNSQNTRINLTNTEPTRSAIVHLFLIDGSSCVVADSLLCLTPNQTTSFLTSDIDPGTTGFIIAVAVNSTGCPINFNYLVGDEYVKFSSGHEANLAAESVTAIAGGLTACNDNSVTAQINFDGVSYSPLPYVLSASSIPSRSDGNDTMLILNRIGGNLGIGVNRLDSLFGIFYDDAERGVSFSFLPGVCQFRSSINNNFPRTTPRFEQFVPPGRTGWFKLWQQNAAAMTGSLINFNPNAAASADAYNQGHNLHVLTNTTSASYIIPVFPPNC